MKQLPFKQVTFKEAKEEAERLKKAVEMLRVKKPEILEMITCSGCHREYEIRTQHQTCPQCRHTFRPLLRRPLKCPSCGTLTYGKGGIDWGLSKGEIDPTRLIRKYRQVGPVQTCPKCSREFVHRGELPVKCPGCGYSA